jgi:hypothetical protein
MLRDVTKGVVAGVSLLCLALLVGLVWAGPHADTQVILDLDPAEGNQALTTKTVEPGEEVTVEVYATVTDISAFTVTIDFNDTKVAFVAEGSTVESGMQVLPPALIDGDAGAVGSVFVGSKSGDPLLLAKMVFTPLEGYGEATLTVSKGEFTSGGVTDTPEQTAAVTITGTAVEAESWGKVKARFVQ